MRLALIKGRRVAYERSGDPAGQPVLIIHGAWGGPSSTLWNGSRIRWSAPTDGLKLIWYDRRCAGLSQYDTEPFTLENLANDAVDLLDYLDIDQAAVIATSAGGPVGMRLALDHPERVESLVLLNTGASQMSLTPTGIDPDDPFVADRLSTVAKRLALLDLLSSKGIHAVIAESEDEWRIPPQPPEPDPSLSTYRENRHRLLQGIGNAELARLARGALLNMQAQRDIDLSGDISRIRCPVLIVHGDADTTVPLAFGQALATAMPNAEFATLVGDGHGLIVKPKAQRIATSWLRQYA
ncbi:MAG: alpha/beta hydrolase [Chloroflexi bacterium]|nr:alpha/beta hydrolase [Chloroflexota bacterium]MYF80241.1 alpha/beta hydrolase [Chloroflexota bacterium]MYI04057.1 alpha/beta hydrolase [Chloroflexota bacterium]